MKIETMHYERKVSDGCYGNRSASLSASLHDGEDPAAALLILRTLVHQRLDDDERIETEERERRWQEDMARYHAEQERCRAEAAASRERARY